MEHPKKISGGFIYAFNGLRIFIKEEYNSRIHFIAALCVLTASFIFRISVYEWLAVIFASGLVISLELINTAIEEIADFISPEKNEKIKKIKDLSAAGVLVGAVTAFIIGLIVFILRLLLLFQKI